MTQSNKRLQAIVLILLTAIVAIGGLLLIMGQLAAPNTAPPVLDTADKMSRSVTREAGSDADLANARISSASPDPAKVKDNEKLAFDEESATDEK